MSSTQRSLAQIPSKSQFLFAIAADSGFTQLKVTNAIAANKTAVNSYDGTILNTKNAGAFIGYINYGRAYAQGQMFRDLGKKLHIQTNGRNEYIFSYVQEVSGYGSEGVPSNFGVNSTTAGNFWLCTWNGDNTTAGIGMNVVRAG